MQNHEPADIHKAITAGAVNTDESSHLENKDTASAEARQAAQEILLSIPGITQHNFRSIMQNVESIHALSKMNETELSPLIGSISAKKVVNFFKQRIA